MPDHSAATIQQVIAAMQSLVRHDAAATDELMKQMIDQTLADNPEGGDTGDGVPRVALARTIARHLLDAGGKKIRPLLCLMANQLLTEEMGSSLAAIAPSSLIIDGKETTSQTIKPIVYLAAAVEFIHQATLFHDDVVDEAATRRHQPTANHIWGNQLPVLVGDVLFARAFQLMVRVDNNSVLTRLSSTAATLAMGEVWQLARQLAVKKQPPAHGHNNSTNSRMNIAEYEKIIFAKTASLFAASFVVAGLLRDQQTTSPVNHALDNFGLHLGMIFQLVDDMLDYQGENLGKEIGGDFFAGKITLPILLLYQVAPPAITARLDGYFLAHGAHDNISNEPQQEPSNQATNYSGKTAADLAWVQRALVDHGVAALADAHIDRHVSAACDALAIFDSKGTEKRQAKDLLLAFARLSHRRTA